MYIPGAVLADWISGAVGDRLGRGRMNGQAFATAFLLALAIRIAMGFEGMVRRMLTRYSPLQTTMLAASGSSPRCRFWCWRWSNDPLWCQRMQSLFYVVIGGVFLAGRPEGSDMPRLPASGRMPRCAITCRT